MRTKMKERESGEEEKEEGKINKESMRIGMEDNGLDGEDAMITYDTSESCSVPHLATPGTEASLETRTCLDEDSTMSLPEIWRTQQTHHSTNSVNG
jgi:hypothetical protein